MSGRPDDSSRSAAGGQPDVEEPELLIDGQEEVFSRAEVESGRIEHLSQAGSGEDRPTDRREPPASSKGAAST